MNVITRGVRNAFRNGIRTFSIAVILGLSIGLALIMLLALKTVQSRIASVKSSVGNTVMIAPAGFSAFSSANNSLTSSQLSSVSKINHVTSVTETLTGRLTTIGSSTPSFPGASSNSNATTSLTSPVKLQTGANGSGAGPGARIFINGGGNLPANFSLPITIVGSTDPTSISGTTVTLSSGKDITGSVDTDNALISSSMASKNSLSVGSTFTAYGTTMTVGGIFTSSTQGADNDVVVALPTEQRLSAQPGDVTAATATVDSVDNLSSTTTAIKNSLGSSADVTNSQQEANTLVSSFQNIETISFFSLIGAVAAGSAIILLTMMMIVRERRREIGVLKAIGSSNLKVMLQFITESITLTLIGAVIGLVIGVYTATPITNVLVTTTSGGSPQSGGGGGFAGGAGRGFGGAARFIGGGGAGLRHLNIIVGWDILLYGLGAAIIIAVVGSAIPAFLISKVRPAEVMRAE